MWSDWLVVCDCSFSLSSLWSPLSVPTILLGFLLPWTWGPFAQGIFLYCIVCILSISWCFWDTVYHYLPKNLIYIYDICVLYIHILLIYIRYVYLIYRNISYILSLYIYRNIYIYMFVHWHLSSRVSTWPIYMIFYPKKYEISLPWDSCSYSLCLFLSNFCLFFPPWGLVSSSILCCIIPSLPQRIWT